ncbi:MAG: hypothetical protein PHE02_08440 [Lachnospiraceae bacterium]|nr:hypothetical protein [Lachnospiraceae bacterium]
MQGLKKALIEETERYKEIFQGLNQDEQQCLVIMTSCNKKSIPMEFSIKDVEEGISNSDENERNKLVNRCFESLCEKQILHELSYDTIIKSAEEKAYGFCEEIFRVYLVDVRNSDRGLDEDF